jgi:hypothetical protein
MPDIPDAQWCLPFRRQQAGASGPVTPMAIGAAKLQAITESTRLATIRRILLQNASTSPACVTNAVRDPISELFDGANPPTPDLYRVSNNRGDCVIAPKSHKTRQVWVGLSSILSPSSAWQSALVVRF